jgi:zinc protease
MSMLPSCPPPFTRDDETPAVVLGITVTCHSMDPWSRRIRRACFRFAFHCQAPRHRLPPISFCGPPRPTLLPRDFTMRRSECSWRSGTRTPRDLFAQRLRAASDVAIQRERFAMSSNRQSPRVAHGSHRVPSRPMVTLHRALALLVLATIGVAPPASAQVESSRDYGPIQDKQLSNGLHVIVQEDHRSPIVSLELRYAAGSRDETEGHEGLALTTFSAMLRATKHVGVYEYGALLSRAGATWSSRVERDYTRLSVTVPSARIELPLWLWSDQMAFFESAFDGKSLDDTRATVLESEAKWRDSRPFGRVPIFLDRALYPAGHPYRSSAAATREGVGAITVADVRAFHERAFIPDRATLVIVGDASANEAFAYAEKYFGPIPRGLEGRSPVVPRVKLEGETRLSIDAHVDAPTVWIRWPTPPFYAPGDVDLDVIARLLGGHRVPHLVWKLVDQRKVATGVYANEASAALGSSFDLRVTGVSGGDARSLLAEVDRALGEIFGGLLPFEDVRRADDEIVLPFTFSLEKMSARARWLGVFRAYHDSTDFFATEVARHQAATSLSIREMAKRWLPMDKRVVALVTPSDDAPVGGTLTGQEFTPASTK